MATLGGSWEGHNAVKLRPEGENPNKPRVAMRSNVKNVVLGCARGHPLTLAMRLANRQQAASLTHTARHHVVFVGSAATPVLKQSPEPMRLMYENQMMT
jgi:hypothetical protein